VKPARLLQFRPSDIRRINIEGDMGGAHTLESSRQDLQEEFTQPTTRNFDHSPDGDLGGAHGESWGFESTMDHSFTNPLHVGSSENSTGQAPEINEVHAESHIGQEESFFNADFSNPPADNTQIGGRDDDFFNADFSSAQFAQADGDTGEASQAPPVLSSHGGSGESRPSDIGSVDIEGDLGGAHAIESKAGSSGRVHPATDEEYRPQSRWRFGRCVWRILGIRV